MDIDKNGPEVTEIRDPLSESISRLKFFDVSWYLDRNPDVAAARLDPLAHYIASGASEGRHPHPLFDASWYLDRNPDVAAAGLNPLAHYIASGASEGRHPHPLFDASWYLERNPDVAAAGLNPLAHYIASGASEGRHPHPLFDASWYLDRNPDVAAAGLNPLAHYIASGASEGRHPHPLFDASWYLERNPDVAATGLNPLAHYIASGASEGRHPHPLFDASWYYGKYPDVAESKTNPLIHYLYCGSSYGTEPHPFFNGAWYLAKYPQLRKLEINPLVHYICDGNNENYDPSPSFSTLWYKGRYLNNETSHINALIHYIIIGKRAGYLPVPQSEIYKKISWMQRTENIKEIFEISRHITLMLERPLFFIFINCADGQAAAKTIESVELQSYPHRQVFFDRQIFVKNMDEILDGRSRDNCFFMWLENGDVLHNAALYHFAAAINRFPDINLLYGDEEIFDERDCSIIPFFKPDWSPDYLESFNYVGQAATYRLSKITSLICNATSTYDLLLQSSEEKDKILHLREILIKSNDRTRPPAAVLESDGQAIAARLHRTSRRGSVERASDNTALHKIVNQTPADIHVTIILYGNAAQDKNEQKYEGDGTGIEGLLVDQRNHFKIDLIEVNSDVRANIIHEINSAVKNSSGAFLLFLDRSIRPIRRHWLDTMVGHFQKPYVGVVGAKLHNRETEIQYTGIVNVDGDPYYVENKQNLTEYFFSGRAVRNFKAVSPACSMTKRTTFESFGGLNETMSDFFSMVDYCYRLSDAGLYNVYEPDAEFTIDSNGLDLLKTFHPKHQSAHTEFFAGSIIVDPFYNTDRLSINPVNYDLRLDYRLGMDL